MRCMLLDTTLCSVKIGKIEKLKKGSGGVSHNYRLAESQCKEYVSSRSFRLMFLRAGEFDAKRTAGVIMSWFDCKNTLWGEDKLGRDITIDDFSEDDLEVLKNGHAQILTSRYAFCFCTLVCNVRSYI